MFKKLLLIILILCVKIYALESRQDLLNKIENLYNEKYNTQVKISVLKCALSQKELKEVRLDSNTPIFPYLNALLELNAKGNIDKLSQDLLMQEAKNKEPLAILLALQLYFVKKCERCEKIRDISGFDYYRFAESRADKILRAEGGSFKASYALNGEAFLCRALQDSKAYNFLNAYANLMLAGVQTRALNALMEGIKRSNNASLYATFRFLISYDIAIESNENSGFRLDILALDSKNYFANISRISNLKNLSVMEGGLLYNYVLFGLLIRDMEMGRIISPFSKFKTQSSLDEFNLKAKHYEDEIKKANLRILQKATPQTLQEYLKILQLKSNLKSQPHPFYLKMFYVE